MNSGPIKTTALQNLLLKDVAEVQMGYSFREKPLLMLDGGIGLIQMRDLQSKNTVNLETVDRVHVETLHEKHLVQPGDIIFRSRGQNLTPALVEGYLPEPHVVSAPLFRIRIMNEKNILPTYVMWCLVQDSAQAYFSAHRVGTHGGMINKTTLDNLPIPVPPIETQQKIIEIANLADRESGLLKAVSEKRHALISAILQQNIKETS